MAILLTLGVIICGWEHKMGYTGNPIWLYTLDRGHPETWPFVPLWKRMILPSLLFIAFIFPRIGCHPSPATPGTFLAVFAAYLLYTTSLWGIYYKNPFLTKVLGNTMQIKLKPGSVITLSRFWFILPAFIALFILYWTGRGVSADCSLA